MAIKDKARNMKQKENALTKDREKGKIEDVIALYPNGVTLIAADVLDDKKEGRTYSVLNFIEDPDHFYFGGSVVTDFIENLVAQYETKDEFDRELSEGLVVKFEKKRSKNGRTYVSVEIVD